MMGGSSKLKNRVCLKVYESNFSHGTRSFQVLETCKTPVWHLPAKAMQRRDDEWILTSISRIIVPGASLTTNPTNIPAKIETVVSWMARIFLICR